MRRRSFMHGCCAGIAAMCGGRLDKLVFADNRDGVQRDVVINVFLRGGMDALSFLIPYADADYSLARPRLKMTTTGQYLPLQSGQVSDIGINFGLHNAAAPLRTLMNNNHLAVVAAAGSPSSTRSHFEAQDYMDRGKPDDDSYSAGWLARYLEGTAATGIFSGISSSTNLATSLQGYDGALALTSANGFTLNAHWNHQDDMRRALRLMYDVDPDLRSVAKSTLDAADYLDYAAPGSYTPTSGVVYPNNSFGASMSSLAQIVKLDIGLQAATVDLGGWDTHETQANSDPATGTFQGLVDTLAKGLEAFWNDLVAQRSRVVVVVMSEFGRRLRENDNRGTDHGHAGIMLVLSTHLAKGRVYGTWPGLAREQLFDSVDVQVTTDFRRVLSEILIARTGNLTPNAIFPGYTYPGPVGLFGTAGALPAVPSGMGAY